MAAAPGDEDPARVVDPDLLHGRVVEERLERPEAGHPGHQLTDHGLDVRHRGHRAGEAALVVVAHHALGDPADDPGVDLRVHPLATHELAHVLVELLDQPRLRVGVRHHHGGPRHPE